MIYGTGVDIIEISRMRDAVKKYGNSFLSKVFTEREIRYSNSRKLAPQHFAVRFAAKEAVVKAFGEPRKFQKWTEIEVLNDKEGKPTIHLHGTALKMKNLKKIKDVVVSMSHSRNYAVANAILLKKGR